ncbi:rab GTPase-binding effector protein 1 isoform X1 [Frankliniella occidentalis]|uniref:Rab GTPase-binding effector protein 1 isoform X1 n=1 Tax=Frankliniella occidentalis TaxID=133901 RepID=A0A6J1SI22_FRAOC|nr:rab GTPase-binding effector protein 1 isoform X1 [Frankliniella occidentalis]
MHLVYEPVISTKMCESGEPNNAIIVDTIGDESGDHSDILQQLQSKISELETEKKEFGSQRAKMRTLILQNEAEKVRLHSEVEELRRQLAVTDLNSKNYLEEEKRKCFEQIASLERLLHETVDESTDSQNRMELELKHLQACNERLELELAEFRKAPMAANEERHQERDRSDPPPIQIFTQATKTFARKVLSELGADSSSTSGKDSLEDSMRKVNKYAQEDAEVLRSLVIPLEEEIEALKEKLREAHEELQKYTGIQHESGSSRKVNHAKDIVPNLVNAEQESLIMMSPAQEKGASLEKQITPEGEATGKDLEVFLSGGSTAVPLSLNTCNMCLNYETGLQKSQQRVKELEKALEISEKNVKRAKDDLSREHTFRQEMEVKWNEKKEQHKMQVIELQKKITSAESSLHDLHQTYTQTYQDVTQQLSRLEPERIEIKREMDRLQAENEKLVGKHAEHSQILQNQIIDLPSNVEALQVLLLQRHEDLIAAKVCAETQQIEADLLREELQIQQKQNAILMSDNQQYQKLVQKSEADKQRIHNLQIAEKQALEKIKDLKLKLDEALQNHTQLEEKLKKQQNRVTSLQHDLDTSEQVQKDFVRLSQSLQVQLESFRQPNTQVRWQHDEDVDECPSCHSSFGSSSRKPHCRHCGRVFCHNCLSHQVPSGPQQRLSRVCDVCHTLLVPNTAPYFSTEPPSTPD